MTRFLRRYAGREVELLNEEGRSLGTATLHCVTRRIEDRMGVSRVQRAYTLSRDSGIMRVTQRGKYSRVRVIGCYEGHIKMQVTRQNSYEESKDGK